MDKVTKEDVEKAEAAAYALENVADAAYDVAAEAAAAEEEAWDNYVKLKREYENDH